MEEKVQFLNRVERFREAIRREGYHPVLLGTRSGTIFVCCRDSAGHLVANYRMKLDGKRVNIEEVL